MFKYFAAALGLTAFLSASPAAAQSSFPETCSNTQFNYSGNNPVIESQCLTGRGGWNATSLTIVGIVVDQNGNLVNTHNNQPSTFQLLCGSIEIITDGPIVSLVAYCPTNKYVFVETSLTLDNISNKNGTLVYDKL